MDAENLQKNLKSEKLQRQTLLKKRSLFVASMHYFVKSLRNVICLGTTKKSMAFYTCGIRDVVLRIFIQNGPMLKEETMAIKESLQDSSVLDQFRASDGWLDT